MSIKDRKSRESKRLRNKILNAALRIFAEQGYTEVSMRKIAASIDYSATTIYRFFQNKEELLWAIAAATYGDLAARFEKVRAGGGGDPLGTLRALITEYIVFCVERPDMFRLYSGLASFEMEGGVMYERIGGNRYKVYQSWFECIRQSIGCGRFEVHDEMRVFLYLWDAVSGYIDHRINQTQVPRKPLAEDTEQFLHLVFRGIEGQRAHREEGQSHE